MKKILSVNFKMSVRMIRGNISEDSYRESSLENILKYLETK